MHPSRFRPVDITVDRPNSVLRIRWDDDQVSELPLKLLRDACPCAQCAGEGAEPIPLELRPAVPPEGYTVQSAELVGNYALQFTWGDGHHFGIYTWDYLRSLPSSP